LVACATAETGAGAILCALGFAESYRQPQIVHRAQAALGRANADLRDSRQEYDEVKQDIENWKDALESCENAQPN
jgi:hypothetical protein